MPPPRRAVTRRSTPPARPVDLSRLSDKALLGTRLCDLGLRFGGSELETRAAVVLSELEGRRIAFRPHMWLSTEWFSPDGVPGIAIPFYLAHPRLQALEAQQMGEVEGGSPSSFLRLLRHEVGHVLDSAYRLHERADWRAVFGPFSAPYRRHYQANPRSKRYVQYLDDLYAQSHPAEDFAETFAVWLDPESRWRTRYRGWPAFEKLAYVNRLMREIAGAAPLVRRRDRIDPISTVTLTLRAYYGEKRRRYHLSRRRLYERDLRQLFRERRPGAVEEDAASYLRRARSEIRKLVSNKTGALHYDIDRVLQMVIERSADLDLVVADGEARANGRTVQRVANKLARYLAQGHHRYVR